MRTVRAKFRCDSVQMFSAEPTQVQTWDAKKREPAATGTYTWPRVYRFSPVYYADVPEDQRYATATPSGELRIQVDNPNVSFEIGKFYHLDITPVEASDTGVTDETR